METFGVLHVEADVAFEDAVVAVDVHFADIDVEIGAYDLRQVEQDALPVDAAQFRGHQVGHGLVLRPFDLLLDDVAAELCRKTVQLVARGLVYDDVSRGGVSIPYHLVARNWLAALRDFELRFRGRSLLCRGDFARNCGIVRLVLLLLGDEEGPEFEYLALGVDLEGFVQVVERDDSRSDLTVQLLLVLAVVNGRDLAQYAAAQLDVQRLHLFVEHLHAPLDVVLPFAFEETLDRLFGLGRGDRFEPFGLGAGVVGRDDLDLVAAVDLRGDRFEFVVDLGADGAVSDLRVDVVGEVEGRGSERHFPGFALGGKYHYFRRIQR